MEGLETLGDQIAEFHSIIKCVLRLIKLHCADFFPPCHFLLCISVYCVVFLLIYLVCVKVMVVVATHWLLWIYCVCLLCTWHEHPPGHLDPISNTVDEFKYH